MARVVSNLDIKQSYTFDLHRGNTGDIILALPYILGMKEAGFDVSLYCSHKAYSPIKDLINIPKASIPAVGYYRVSPNRKGIHMTDKWGYALKAKGLDISPARLPLTDYKSNEYILINPWCAMPSKRLSARQLEAVCTTALDSGYKVVMAGPSHYIRTLEQVKDRYNELEILTGDDWVSTIKNARLVVTPDSGAGHVADALGIPTVIVFRSTCPKTWAPYWNRQGAVYQPNSLELTNKIKEQLL